MNRSKNNLRDHLFLGTTQSFCPDCLRLVTAKIIVQDQRVYFDKFCPQHGPRRDFVCSDVSYWDRLEFNVPGRLPDSFGTEPQRGCPYDCGLCSAHEQHTCIAVLEITSSCNLTCPMCYASSGPGGQHLSLAECQQAIDRLVLVEGRAEILQLSGGEPTIHPQFELILDYGCQSAIDLVMINTNGIRLANDRQLCEFLAERRPRLQVYLQFDGLTDSVYEPLRGVSLLEQKLRAVERLGEYGINTTLVTTVQPGVNVDQIGKLVDFARVRPWITGVSFQPATYVGRTVLPSDLEQRVTFPDIIREVVTQSAGPWIASDFFPVPCAHPNAHSIAYAFRHGEQVTPITRFVDIERHYDLLANGISLNRQNTRQIIAQWLERETCGADCSCFGSTDQLANGLPSFPLGSTTAGSSPADPRTLLALAESFFSRALSEDLAAADMFRITTTSFMDAYNFDVRQIMKSCVHHLLPSGHLIPFCAYNLLYRNGHVALPPLQTIPAASASTRSRDHHPSSRPVALPVLGQGRP